MSNPEPSPSTRRVVFGRAGHKCEYCHSQSRFIGPLTIDHIIPRVLGGGHTSENLAAACLHCNLLKHGHVECEDPLTGLRVQLFNPRSQSWSEHFRWDDEAVSVIPITAIGRGTVEMLQLNRESLCNLRRVLAAFGEHPPL